MAVHKGFHNFKFQIAATKPVRKVQETHQEMRDPNVTSLYVATRLAFNALDGGVPLRRSP